MQCLQRKNAQLLCLKLFRILSSTLRREPLLHMSSIGVQHIMQHVHMIQHCTGTLGHAIQRVLRNMHINAGLALDQLIQTAQQSAAASQGNAAVDDIRAQLRRGALQRLLDGGGDLDPTILQATPQFVHHPK